MALPLKSLHKRINFIFISDCKLIIMIHSFILFSIFISCGKLVLSWHITFQNNTFEYASNKKQFKEIATTFGLVEGLKVKSHF